MFCYNTTIMEDTCTNQNRIIDIWTDGACLGNPGHAAWGALVDRRLFSGYIGIATNNIAEISAVYNGIIRAPSGSTINIFTDSNLVVGVFCRGWRSSNEVVGAYKRIIDDLRDSHNLRITFRLVKGHSGIYENELVDSAASSVARSGKSGQSTYRCSLFYPQQSNNGLALER